MKDGPSIAPTAALIGDPARANMLTALVDGRALTVSELAGVAGVTLATASGHLARLAEAGLLAAERQGRHRYYRLSGAEVAHALEALMGLAQHTGAVRVRTGPNDAALREARVCYDHLAGRRAVRLWDGLVARGLVADGAEPVLTAAGRSAFTALGFDVARLERGRRPLCRACLDWSERRRHLAGALGAAVLDHALAVGWAQRAAGRAVRFTPTGAEAFDAAYAVEP